MKKLLYLGLTALMMLFAVGFAKADNAKVKVELNPTTWTIGGETAPQFTVTITAATATEGEETPAALTLGTETGNVAVKVALTLDGTTKNQVITSTPVDLTTTDLTAGTWALTYELVKGEDQTTAFDGAAEMDNTASTTSLTINAAAPVEKTATPTFKVGEDDKTAYELDATEGASVTVTIVAAEGATVYYTIDGTEPTTTTTTTGTSVVINTACTLKAIAQETGKNASDVASFEVTKAEAPAPVEDKVVAPTFNPAAGEVEADATVTIATTTGDAKIYYRKGEKAGEYTEYAAPVTITEACTLWAFASNGMTNSDTLSAAYTIKAPTPVVRPTVTLSFVTPSSVGGSYAEPDTTYNTVMPEFSVKVEGVTPGLSGTPAVAVHYEIYRFIDGKDSLIEDNHKFNTTFEVGRMDEPFPNDTYKIVISVDERSAERNEDYEWDWTPYNGADGKVAQLTGFFKIAAPAWTLVSPELEVEEDEYWETILPAKTRENGPRVEIKTENCEDLFGNGEDKMIICKQVSVPSLMKNPVIGGMGGLTGAYTIYDTMIPSDGNIVWTLPIGWVDSVKKAITAEVAAILEEAEDDDEAAAMREYYAFKDVEDLSDCNIMVMAGTLMDMSEYGMEGVMFMPAEDYPSMYIEIPFTVIDTIFAPSFSLEAGEVTVNTDLWITADLATDTIYYRVDEGAFQKAESINTVSILLDKDMTVSAYAISKTGRMSDTVTAAYTVVEETEESELTVEAVGATKEGENYTFSAAEVAFDMFVKNKVEGDTLTISIYTKTQYDTMGQVEPQKKAVADSVRFETTLEDGEYVGVFAIVRKSDKVGEVVVADETISFTVKKGEEPSAIEAAELAGVNVYPNPNAGAFNVAVPERARVEIFGLNGAMLMSREVNAGVEAFSIDHSGIYFVRVMAGNKTAVKRVVVR